MHEQIRYELLAETQWRAMDELLMLVSDATQRLEEFDSRSSTRNVYLVTKLNGESQARKVAKQYT